MSLFQAVLLGLLQGATEFLPVSSSGHLVLVPWLLGWSDPGIVYDAFVHLATLLAVIVYFWGDIVALVAAGIRTIRQRAIATPEERLAWLLVASAIPAGLLGYFLEDFFTGLFGSPRAVGVLLLVTGLLLVGSERVGRRERGLDSLKLPDALWIGLAQACAVMPGLSRSGATISAGLLRGLRRDEAARFSFLMGIPIILGAGALQVVRLLQDGLGDTALATLAAGFIAAALSGYLAIRFLLGYVRSHNLRPFAYYCFVAGTVAIVLTALA